ncbi:hypothetical protein [Xanthomonas campestris]|uniref:hypothetical protein n=1 Tax=Xanthomonas campestris TaxID=339 RepID=UPI0011C45FD3|nr:hypothetical protein [Xanthomonas campestris]
MTAEFFRVGRIGTSSEQLLVNALVAARSPAQFEQHHASDSPAVVVDPPGRSADCITGIVLEVPQCATPQVHGGDAGAYLSAIDIFLPASGAESVRSDTSFGVCPPVAVHHQPRNLSAKGQPTQASSSVCQWSAGTSFESYLPVAGHHELRELFARGQPAQSVPISTPLKPSVAQARLAECKALSACWLLGM